MDCTSFPRCGERRRAIRSPISISALDYFPVLRALRKPIVYTVVSSLAGQAKPAHLASLKALHRIVVPSERYAEVLETWGVKNYSVVRSAPDRGVLQPSFLPLERELTLLMASAPWSRAQFDEKGIDTLLEAVAQQPNLRLIFVGAVSSSMSSQRVCVPSISLIGSRW